MKSFQIALILVVFSGLGACKSVTVDSTKLTQDGAPVGDMDRLGELVALFHDTANYEMPVLQQGNVCASLIQGKVSFRHHPWPADLKNLLVREMAVLPQVDFLRTKIHGIYNVDFIWMEEDPEIGGYTCQNGPNGKYVVFLANRYIRTHGGRIVQTSGYDLEVPGIHHFQGDYVVASFFHELFHVLDFAMFLIEGDQNAQRQREQLVGLSWERDFRTPKFNSDFPMDQSDDTTTDFQDSAGFGLTGNVNLGNWLQKNDIHGRARLAPNVNSLNLTNSSLAGQWQRKLENLRIHTNFIVPEAETNFVEDFAETLESYYMNTRYDSSVVYRILHDSKSYVYDDGEVLKKSDRHRNKACQIVQAAFGERCRL